MLTSTSSVQTLNQTLSGDQVAADPFVYSVGGVDRFGVVWQGDVGSGTDLFFRALGVGGFVLGSELAVMGARPGNQIAPAVTVLAGGQTVLSWAEATGGAGEDADGDIVGGQSIRTLIGTANAASPFQNTIRFGFFGENDEVYGDPELLALSNGTFALTADYYVGDPESPESVSSVLSLWAADGTPIVRPEVMFPNEDYAGATDIGELSNGSLYSLTTQIVFSNMEASDANVLERIFSGTTAAPLGAARNLTPEDFAGLAQIIQLTDGRLVGAAEVLDDIDRIVFGSVSPLGILQNDLSVLNDRDTFDNDSVSLAATPDGGFVAVWETLSEGGRVVIRRFDIDLQPLGPSEVVSAGQFAFGANPEVVVTSAGEVLVTWTSGGTGDDIFARTYTLDDLGTPGITRTGTPQADRLTGGANDDTLTGLDGADVLDGRGGADVMSGGLGNDFYFVDTRADQIVGEIAFSQGGGIDTVRTFVNYTQPDNIELVRLGFIGGQADLSVTGNDAPGTLVGNAGDNILVGRGGNDQLNGNNGADTITGNTGRDTLVGGNGADTFIYTTYSDSRAGAANRDVVNGFERGTITRDVIDLSMLDANTRTFGVDDAFTFVGSARFSGQAGELRTQNLGGPNAILIEADHNGDRVADLQIFVNLQTVMFAGDFIL